MRRLLILEVLETGTWKEWSGCSRKGKDRCVKVREGMVRTSWIQG